MVAAVAILAACFSFVLAVYALTVTDKDAGRGDFVEYWAAGQQLAHGANPYDVPAMLRLERAVGRDADKPKFTLSPPIVLLLAFPLGFTTAKIGLICWMMVLNACLFTSILLLWMLERRPDSVVHWLSYFFPPALATLMAGQIGMFILLGLVLFLYFYDSHPVIAGAVLLPCALKPHLFVPFSMVLLLWIVDQKAYPILVGFSAALVAAMALTLCLPTPVWVEYFEMMRRESALHQFVPTLSVAFRYAIDRNAVWLQFLPQIAGSIWAVWYFCTHRKRWTWMEEGSLVLLVSVVCAPYSFLCDEVVLLPAVVSAEYRAVRSHRSLIPIGLIAGLALVELYTWGRMSSPFYVWTAPAWLGWYLYATWGSRDHADEARAVKIAAR